MWGFILNYWSLETTEGEKGQRCGKIVWNVAVYIFNQLVYNKLLTSQRRPASPVVWPDYQYTNGRTAGLITVIYLYGKFKFLYILRCYIWWYACYWYAYTTHNLAAFVACKVFCWKVYKEMVHVKIEPQFLDVHCIWIFIRYSATLVSLIIFLKWNRN